MESHGITLAGIQAFIASRGGAGAFRGLTTAEVCEQHMKPATARAVASFCVAFPAHTGPATVFVSHAWAYLFLKLVEALEAWEANRIAAGATTPTFFWFDLFTNSQHGVVSRPFEWWRNTFTANVSAIGHTLLVLEWEDPKPLKRAWCLLEITASLQPRQPTPTLLEVIMAPEEEAAFEAALVGKFNTLVQHTCTVNVARAEAFKAEDKQRIFEALEATLGFEEVNKQVIGRMQEWMAEAGRAALERLGVEERGTSDLLFYLAGLLMNQGKLNEAELLYCEALAACRRTLGNEHPDTLASINNMAILLKAQGKLDVAEPLYLEALAASRRTLGNEHPDTLASINNLALLLSDQGKLGEAEPLNLEALAACRRTLGNEHPSTLASINNLANLLSDQGKLGEAEPLYLEALAARRRTLGNDHPDTLGSINSLANLLKTQGKLGEAEPLYLEALAAKRRTLGNDHPSTLDTIYNFAGLLLKQGKREEALEQYRLELEGVRRVRGESHPSTQQSMRNYQQLVGEK